MASDDFGAVRAFPAVILRAMANGVLLEPADSEPGRLREFSRMEVYTDMESLLDRIRQMIISG